MGEERGINDPDGFWPMGKLPLKCMVLHIRYGKLYLHK